MTVRADHREFRQARFARATPVREGEKMMDVSEGLTDLPVHLFKIEPATRDLAAKATPALLLRFAKLALAEAAFAASVNHKPPPFLAFKRTCLVVKKVRVNTCYGRRTILFRAALLHAWLLRHLALQALKMALPDGFKLLRNIVRKTATGKPRLLLGLCFREGPSGQNRAVQPLRNGNQFAELNKDTTSILVV